LAGDAALDIVGVTFHGFKWNAALFGQHIHESIDVFGAHILLGG
jgi:hypothetical protein